MEDKMKTIDKMTIFVIIRKNKNIIHDKNHKISGEWIKAYRVQVILPG